MKLDDFRQQVDVEIMLLIYGTQYVLRTDSGGIGTCLGLIAIGAFWYLSWEHRRVTARRKHPPRVPKAASPDSA